MKLFYSIASPFVRKCLVSAHELGLVDRLELLPAAAHPVNRDRSVVAHNPLGKVPTLIMDDGNELYDSRVICEFLNSLGDGHLLPAQGAARWQVLLDQALADGLLDAAVLTRYETLARPEKLRWPEWIVGQLEKVDCALAQFERRAPGFANRVDLGTISAACALGYLDFRYEPMGWRAKYPHVAVWYQNFGERPSMIVTRPL
jgi:glutathione S-transferase